MWYNMRAMNDKGEKDRADFSVGRVTRFYVPLLMQAFLSRSHTP